MRVEDDRGVHYSAMTVGELRAELAMHPADMPVSIPGGEYDYTEATHVRIETVEWHETDENCEPEEGPAQRVTLVIHNAYA